MSATAASADGCDGLIAYASSELSLKAYKSRMTVGFSPTRNVAVARVQVDSNTEELIVGFSEGDGYHAENHILDQLAERNISPSKITEFYRNDSRARRAGRFWKTP